MLKKNDCYEATITGMSNDGNGVARIENIAVFIPNCAVGDLLSVRIVKVQKTYAFGIVDRVIEPSVTRIQVDCDCNNQCGGCAFRHISYQAELEFKQDFVVQAFKRISGISADCLPIIGSAQSDRYRNKAQYPLALIDGEVACGFFAKRSHRVIDSEDCMLQPTEFKQIRAAIVRFVVDNKISIYSEETKLGEIRHIYLRKAVQTGETMVCIVVKKSLQQSDKLIAYLTTLFPTITSIVINKNSKDTNVILGEKCETIYGKDYITDIICDIKVMISPLAFYQVNKPQAEVLYGKAIEFAAITKQDVLVDLYCGTGTIGLIAAKVAKSVIGVEIVPEAIENAKSNARLNSIDNIEFICADAAGATKQLLSRGVTPTAVIVDPPRKGLDDGVALDIVAMSPARIVMVSCNPATAARDTKIFCDNGYEVEAILPVDMFPRTTHVECVVKLCRKDI